MPGLVADTSPRMPPTCHAESTPLVNLGLSRFMSHYQRPNIKKSFTGSFPSFPLRYIRHSSKNLPFPFG